MDPNAAVNLKARFEALKTLRANFVTLWGEIARYVLPRRLSGIMGTVAAPGNEEESRLFDTTAVRANVTMANGQLAWMSPSDSPWFEFQPPLNLKEDDEAKRWTAECTNRAREELAQSNFYTSVHEFYLDRSAFGTAALYLEDRDGDLNFISVPIGTFVFTTNHKGTVDTFMREISFTPSQAQQMFGSNISAALLEKASKPATQDVPVKFLHAVFKRDPAKLTPDDPSPKNMPFASTYMELDATHICEDGGVQEMPFLVSRFMLWSSSTGSVYGSSPASAALADARQVNFLQKMMDALAEKMAFPPVLAPEELEGEIDPNAYGVTYFSKEMGAMMPKEWMTEGRYDIGLQRVQERQKAIENAFQVDLFQMFANIDKQMTAREVMERSSEKVVQFNPTFARLTSELFNPLLQRTFNIMLRRDKFGKVPDTMITPVDGGNVYIPAPIIRYASRLSLALKAAPSMGYHRTLERLSATAAIAPQVIDNFDWDRAERDMAMSDGTPPEFLIPMEKVAEIRQARAEQQAQQQQQEQAMMAADAAAKVGGIPGDSPIGKEISKQMGGAR
jgi:hypothetical protein